MTNDLFQPIDLQALEGIHRIQGFPLHTGLRGWGNI